MTFSPGASIAHVQRAERALGVCLPDALREAYVVANTALELVLSEETWWTFPVFDPENAPKTSDHLAHRNAAEQRFPGFPPDAICIALDGCGNNLALRIVDSRAQEQIYRWDHDTRKMYDTATTVAGMLEAAREYVARIQKLRTRRGK